MLSVSLSTDVPGPSRDRHPVWGRQVTLPTATARGVPGLRKRVASGIFRVA